MDDDERLHALMELLDYGNMPKMVKKKALFEICKMVGVRFSTIELEAVERAFTMMERSAVENVEELTCPFCRTPIYVLDLDHTSAKARQSGKNAYVRHLEKCSTLKMLISEHIAVMNATPRGKHG